MSADANKAVSRRFLEEVANRGNLSVADELFAPNHVNRGTGIPPGLPTGPEGNKVIVMVYRTAFPDLRFTIDEQIAEGDTVMTRWTGTGTHLGELTGMAPTGRQVTISGVTVDRFVDGKIAESWGVFDQFEMLQQLGVMPGTG